MRVQYWHILQHILGAGLTCYSEIVEVLLYTFESIGVFNFQLMRMMILFARKSFECSLCDLP